MTAPHLPRGNTPSPPKSTVVPPLHAAQSHSSRNRETYGQEQRSGGHGAERVDANSHHDGR